MWQLFSQYFSGSIFDIRIEPIWLSWKNDSSSPHTQCHRTSEKRRDSLAAETDRDELFFTFRLIVYSRMNERDVSNETLRFIVGWACCISEKIYCSERNDEVICRNCWNMEIFIIFFFSSRLFIIFFFYYTSFDYWFCVRTRRDGLLNVVRISKASIPPLCWKLNNNLSLSSREKNIWSSTTFGSFQCLIGVCGGASLE